MMLFYDKEKGLGVFKETRSVIDASRGINKKPHEQKPDYAGQQTTVGN